MTIRFHSCKSQMQLFLNLYQTFSLFYQFLQFLSFSYTLKINFNIIKIYFIIVSTIATNQISSKILYRIKNIFYLCISSIGVPPGHFCEVSARWVFVLRKRAVRPHCTCGERIVLVQGGYTVKEIRNYVVRARVTQTEYELFLTNMRLEGFRNPSRYIRKKLLGQFISRKKFRSAPSPDSAQSPTSFSQITEDVVIQLADIKKEIRKIGVNYNQKVKTLNSLSLLRDSYGRAVITEEMVENYLRDMKIMMSYLIDKINNIENCVSTLESK